MVLLQSDINAIESFLKRRSKKKSGMTESDLLNAWLWEKHRENLQWRRVRLGVLPTKELNRMYLTILRWADAIVIKDGIVFIVEAKLRAQPGVISQLQLYDKLFGQTPEFSQYWLWPRKLMILSSVVDLNMVELASDKGILFELFTEEEVNITRKAQMLPVI